MTMRVGALVRRPFCWLALTAWMIPLPIVATVVGGSTLAAAGEILAGGSARVRPKPFCLPSQIVFGESISRTQLAWRVVPYDEVNRQRALAWLRSGRELPGGVFAAARTRDGSYIFIYSHDVKWGE